MTPDLPKNNRAELEERVTAFVLGELPPSEAESMRQLLAQDAELRKWSDELQLTLSLLHDAVPVANEKTLPQPAPLKLSEARRQRLLAHFKTVKPQFERQGKTPAIMWVGVAAVFAIVLSGLMLPALSRGRATSKEMLVMNNLRLLDSAKQWWALEQGKKPTDTPTMKDLEGYMGRGASAGLPESVKGETYVLGPVGKPPVAVVGGKVITLPGAEAAATETFDRARIDSKTATLALTEAQRLAESINPSAPTGAFPGAVQTGKTQTLEDKGAVANSGAYPANGTIGTANNDSLTLVPNGGIASANDNQIAGVGGVPTITRSYANVQLPPPTVAPPPPVTDSLPETPPTANSLNNGLAENEALNQHLATQSEPLPASVPVAVAPPPTTNVYSLNAAGYMNVAVPPGFEVTQDQLAQQQPPVATTAASTSGIFPWLRNDYLTSSGHFAPPAATPPSNDSVARTEAEITARVRTQVDVLADDYIASSNYITAGESGAAPGLQAATGTTAYTLPVGGALPAMPPGFRGGRRASFGTEGADFGGGGAGGGGAWSQSAGPTGQATARYSFQANLGRVQNTPVPSNEPADAPSGAQDARTLNYKAPSLGDVPTAGALFSGKSKLPEQPRLPSPALVGIGLQGGTAPVQYAVASDISASLQALGKEGTSLQALKKDTDAPLPNRPPTAPIIQPEVKTSDQPFSTFSLNVSDVSFRLTEASLDKGVLPDAGSVRSEEFINAFDYRDPEPAPGAPVAFAWERANDPYAHDRDLLRFSIKTAAEGRQGARPLNIVLLLDKSGSMERVDRVEITRRALAALSAQLQPQDTLSVVVFARTARLWADGVTGDKAADLVQRLGDITPEGGTNLEEAMRLAYEAALRHYSATGENRVVLLTDGAANLGEVSPDTLKRNVETNRAQGVSFDCFGIGWEDYNDELLETLSRTGGGRYGFINTPQEADTDFAGELAGALRVAAQDVKTQVEFNSNRVSFYRQIGYAKDQLTKEQFRDNTVKAAQLGAAEAGNALYAAEVNPNGDGPICTVRVRYRLPGTEDYREQEWTVPYSGPAAALDQSTPAMRLAATASAFSEWLAGSPFAGEVTLDKLSGNLAGVPDFFGADTRPKKLETMILQARSIAGK